MRIKLHWQIFISILLAVLAGSITGEERSLFGIRFYDAYQFAGTLFLNALKMLIVPLITSAIISGVVNVGNHQGFSRLGIKTILYYMGTSLVAILTGLLMVNIIMPGADIHPANHELQSSVMGRLNSANAGDIVDVFIRMVPPNIVKAAANGQMLGLIFFTLLFGYFISQLSEELQSMQRKFWNGVYQVMMKFTDLIMKFAPVGVFGLVASIVARTGFEQFSGVAMFFLTVFVSLSIHTFFTMPLILRFLAGASPMSHFKSMAPALLTAFSTSSSSATLPVTLDCVENNAGVSNKISSFVIPLGATVNMDGTALYECVAAMFIAQSYGITLSAGHQFFIVVTALLTSIGVAGIPSASLVAIGIILTSSGLPLEGMGLIMVVDRILDMCRTSVNVFSDSCGAVIIAASEGEKG